jgi:hypothetical protein
MSNHNYHNRSDGEVFTDVPRATIPLVETWDSLSTNELLDVQTTMQMRLWEFSGNPAMVKAIQIGIDKLQQLINKKLATSA